MSRGNGGGGITDRLVGAGIDVFKGYLGIIFVVFLVAGAATAASIATTIAIAGGNVLGIGVGNLGNFGSSVIHGQSLVKKETATKDPTTGTSTDEKKEKK